MGLQEDLAALSQALSFSLSLSLPGSFSFNLNEKRSLASPVLNRFLMHLNVHLDVMILLRLADLGNRCVARAVDQNCRTMKFQDAISRTCSQSQWERLLDC